MSDGAIRYDLDRAEVERAWTGHVTTSAGERWHQRYVGRHIVEEFLDSVSVAGLSGGQRLVIGQQRILAWMIQDVEGKALSYAAERLAILDRFLKVLARAGLVGHGLLPEHRTGPGRRSWRCLAEALQAKDPEAALQALRLPPPPPGPLAASL